MIKLLFLLWIVGLFLSWLILFVHDVLVTKYQPEQKGRYYWREMTITWLFTLIPVVNWIVFIRILYNIARFNPPEKEED